MTVTSVDQLDPEKTYTYSDYLKWQFDEYVELIKGKIFKMSPSPSASHQKVSRNLVVKFGTFLDRKKCQVFHAPFDVRLKRKEEDQIYTVVQPDLCVICDPSKIDEKGCFGAPDLIIEILSPATSRKDVRDKFELYQESGVLEYWVVEPLDKLVDVFVLKEGQYTLVKKYVVDDLVPVNVLSGLTVDLKEVFE